MRCSKAQSYLSRELDEQLPADVVGDLDRHLDGCAGCREYRADLALGQRLLAASEPELPENFEWKLQLRLNQALRESAGEHLFPWQEEERPARWAFLRSFGTSAAVGLAAVLAVAMVVGPAGVPVGDGPRDLAGSPVAEAAGTATGDDSRRSLYGRPDFGSSDRRVVSGGGGFFGAPQGSPLTNQGWSAGDADNASRAILYLQNEARRLRTENFHLQRELEKLQSRLDTIPAPALDLQETR
jgi:hypothetical protein